VQSADSRADKSVWAVAKLSEGVRCHPQKSAFKM